MSLASKPETSAIKAGEALPGRWSHRKPSWRFSLASLLLITALLITIVSHIHTSRNLAQLRRESYGLELGVLDRIYVRKLPQASFSVWQWKAHIPATRRFRINVATRGINDSSLPRPDAHDAIEFQGELIINVIQHHTDIRDPALGVTVTVHQNNMTRESAFVRLPPVVSKGGNVEVIAGAEKTESFSGSEPVVLLRKAMATHFSNQKVDPDGEMHAGILVWIDEIPTLEPGWKKIENQWFSFSVPGELTKIPIQSEDSFVESYGAGGMELSFDYGMYSEKLSDWPDSTLETLTIDGRTGGFVTAQREYRLGFPFTTQLYVDVDRTNGLSMFAACKTKEDVAKAHKIFESIHLKPQ